MVSKEQYLVVRGPEPSSHVLIIHDLYLEGKVFLQLKKVQLEKNLCEKYLWLFTYILNNHNKERKLDSKSLLLLTWAFDEGGRNVCSHDF